MIKAEQANYCHMGISDSRIVSEDVSNIPDEQLVEMLDDIHYELIPEDFEEDEQATDGQ